MKKNRFFFLFLLSQLLSVWALAQVNQPVVAYVSITGTRQGQFKGTGLGRENEGKIECIGFSYSVKAPHDQLTGMITGKRQQSPLVIVKHLDGASPQLLNALYTGEVLKTVTIEFYKRGPGGQQTLLQTIRLSNAAISEISQYAGTTSPDKLIPNAAANEEVSLVFQKIEIENNESKTSAIDNWNTSR